MHITLKPGEKIYLNGAVLRADRKVSIELMNDATFLLEPHVMQPQKATTPVRQLYFIVQTMLMSPADVAVARGLFDETISRMLEAYDDRTVLDAMASTRGLVERGRYFEALKLLRGLFSHDDDLIHGSKELALAG